MKERIPLSGPNRFLSPTLTVLLLTLVVCGCRPDLPSPSSHSSPSEPSSEFVVHIEPEAPLTAAPRVLRAHLQWADPIDKARVFLIRGEVTDYHLRQIERDDLTKTLQERIVPALVWAENERHVVIAPTAVLEPGQTYALASGDPSRAEHFVVAKEQQLPLLSRIWPAPDVPARFGIFCGDEVLPNGAWGVSLDPLGPLGILQRGFAVEGPGARCLRFRTHGRETPEANAWVLPPLLDISGLGAKFVQLDPVPFVIADEVGNEIPPLECDREEVAFGLGCALVMDDRIVVRAPLGDLLWGISGVGMEKLVKTSTKERFVIKELLPETELTFVIVTVDTWGRTRKESFTATTSSLSAHVVINEVLANPIGPEPHQEWVELYNDGQVGTSLLGYRILDIGGDTVLPDVYMAPGQWVIVVNETFVEDDEVDIPVPPEALIVRVTALGKSGLSNSGELLRLVDPEGHTISRFPALPKPKAGQSVSRRTPDAPDGVSSSFALTEPTPGNRNDASKTP